MTGRLIDALLELETVARIGARTLGENSHMGRQLLLAVTRVRFHVAPIALADALNHYRELHPTGKRP